MEEKRAKEEGSLDYHFAIWMAERGVNAPIGTPPREEPATLASPCGCLACELQNSGSGELVCINCGVITGPLMSGIDFEIDCSISR